MIEVEFEKNTFGWSVLTESFEASCRQVRGGAHLVIGGNLCGHSAHEIVV
jgi:hypothetical protein